MSDLSDDASRAPGAPAGDCSADPAYVRYFEYSREDGDEEVDAATAEGLEDYTRELYDASGRKLRSELYRKGGILRVDYYDVVDDDAVTAFHVRTYPGTVFHTWRERGRVGTYLWEEDHYYSATGERRTFSLVLSDEQDLSWMVLEFDEERKPVYVLKHHWDGRDLRWNFEYDEHGTLFDCHDTHDFGGSRFSEIRHLFTDAEFYEHGFNLPRDIAGTPIPL